MLRSIPPQNRQQSLDRFSSMRAASRSGFIFVGSHAAQFTPTQRYKQTRAIPPDPKVKQSHEQIHKALCQLATWIGEQITTAETPEELSFWQAALTRLKRE